MLIDKQTSYYTISLLSKILGSGALPGKMFLVRIIEHNKIDAYFRSG